MKELSVFVDESGSFGPYQTHSPYYIVTLLLHDQSKDITDDISLFTRKLTDWACRTIPFIQVHLSAGSLSMRTWLSWTENVFSTSYITFPVL